MKKDVHGSMFMMTSKNTAIVAWKYKKVVTMASNAYGINLVTRVNRIATVSHERRKILAKCPKVVNMYNSYMGGAERFNQDVHSQRISFRGKKWWYLLFAFGFDASCQNAWQIHKRVNNKNITYCEYRRHIVLSYLRRNSKKVCSSWFTLKY